jgi:VWA domain-containing protein
MNGLQEALRAWTAEWSSISVAQLQFWHRDTGRLALIGLLLVTIVLLAWRSAMRRHPARAAVALPSLLRTRRGTASAWLRHTPLVPFAAGVPLMLLALADPYSALVKDDVSYPGRRISLMIDASISMTSTFTTETLDTVSKTGPTFFTTVAAAERFVQLRQKGRQRDLVALVEFGDQAYVITPFTSDYDNILLSIALIKDPVEFSMFPNRGTVIARALEQSLALFKAFDVLDATGNLMVIFTDGEDTTALTEGQRLEDILDSAVQNKVPLYFVRTNFAKSMGELIPDIAWKTAVERTGGRFYAVRDEASLLTAIDDIDRVAAGTIRVTRYTSQQPQFAVFALAAAACWTVAAGLKLGIARFQRLP